MDLLGLFILFLLIGPILLLAAYIRKTRELTGRILYVEREIVKLRNLIDSMKATPARPVAPAEAPPKPEVVPSAATAPSPRPAAKPSVVPPPRPKPAAPPPPSRTREEWEALIGGKLLNRIGAFAIILGVGFFLKYAFDNNLISETMRVVIGFVTGALLLFGGARFHKKNLAIFAQGLIGAGIAILYLSVYASFNFYHLVSQPVAFVFMSAVTALTFWHALKYDSLAVSLLGWAGGFLTPIMLSTGQANEVGLFTYIALLDLGLMAIMLRKDGWMILEPLTLGATYLLYFAWYDEYYRESDLPVTVFFLTIFWGLFYALEVLRAHRGITAFQKIRQVFAAGNALFYYSALYGVVNSAHHSWMSAVTLLLGGIYFFTFYWLNQRLPQNSVVLARYTLTAVVLLVIATEVQFTGFRTAIFWSLEALALVWCGMRWKMRHVWQAALILVGLAFVKLLFTNGTFAYAPVQKFILIFNQRALAFVVLAGVLGASAILLKPVTDASGGLIRTLLHGGWCVLLFMLCTVETNDYFRQRLLTAAGATAEHLSYNRILTLAATWMFYSLPLAWLGWRQKIHPVVHVGLASLAIAVITVAIIGITYVPIALFTFALNWRTVVFVLVIAGVVVHAKWMHANQQDYAWIKDALSVLHIAVVLLLLDLLTGETRDIFERAIYFAKQRAGDSGVSAEISRLQDLKQLTLSGVWLFYSVFLMVAGIWRRLQGLRIMAIALFGITIVKIFIYDLSFLAGLYRIFSFIGLGVILLAMSYLYQRYKAVIFDSAKSS